VTRCDGGIDRDREAYTAGNESPTMSIETGVDGEEADDGAETEAEADARVDELAADLGDAVADLPAYRRFESAREAVQTDADLQERIEAFEQRRQEFVLARQSGEATQKDVREIEQAQRELHAHPEMAEFLEAKEALQERLEALNETISEPLAVDFGGEAGGCCQD
jgi:cell fate (sporulation/competence/biofilm development) regulator YlbF (YheA/YmcA/DUF963 family)